MDHTVLPANNTMPALPSWHSPDVTTRCQQHQSTKVELYSGNKMVVFVVVVSDAVIMMLYVQFSCRQPAVC